MSETAKVADQDRVSDAERERTVSDLTRHCGDGRLTLDELEERVSEVYAAMTRADLEHALRELPKNPIAIRPMAAPQVKQSAAPVRTTVKKGAEVALKVHLYVYLCVMAFLVLIWFLTTPFDYPWPIWPGMSWGLLVALQAGVTKAINDN